MSDNVTSNDTALATSTGTTPGDPSQSQDAPAVPQQDSAPQQPATGDAGQSNPQLAFNDTITPPLPAVQQHESKWANVVKGAFAGFLQGGAPGFVEGAIAPKLTRQSLQNKMDLQKAQVQEAQGRVQFQNLQAAKISADIALEKAQTEHYPEAMQLQKQQMGVEMVKDFIAAGMRPSFSSDNTPQGYQEAHEELASRQPDGKMPSAQPIDVPGGKTLWFTLDGDAEDKMLSDISDMRIAQAGRADAAMDRSTWTNKVMTPPSTRTALVKTAMSYWNPPLKTGDDLDAQTKRYDFDLAQAKSVPDEAWPNKAKIVDRLQRIDDMLHKQYVTPENSFKARVGQSIAKTRAVALAGAQYKEFTMDDGATYYMPVSEGSAQGLPSAKASRDASPYIQKAEDAETSYQKFLSAYREFKSGAATGAPAMVALSSHLATTLGTVKGAKVGRDMIMEHLGAKSVSDKGLTAVQKLVNGDPLSPGQWEDFKTLITDTRKYAWGTASKEAYSHGFVLRRLVPQDLGGGGDITHLMNPNQAQQTVRPQTATSKPAAKQNRPPLSNFEQQR